MSEMILEKKTYDSEKLRDFVEYFEIPGADEVITLVSKSGTAPQIENVLLFQNVEEFQKWADDLKEDSPEEKEKTKEETDEDAEEEDPCTDCGNSGDECDCDDEDFDEEEKEELAKKN